MGWGGWERGWGRADHSVVVSAVYNVYFLQKGKIMFQISLGGNTSIVSHSS